MDFNFSEAMNLIDERNVLLNELEYLNNQPNSKTNSTRYSEIQDRLNEIYEKLDTLGW